MSLRGGRRSLGGLKFGDMRRKDLRFPFLGCNKGWVNERSGIWTTVYTYTLKLSDDVLRNAEVFEVGLYIVYNVVDDRAVNLGLNRGCTVIKEY